MFSVGSVSTSRVWLMFTALVYAKAPGAHRYWDALHLLVGGCSSYDALTLPARRPKRPKIEPPRGVHDRHALTHLPKPSLPGDETLAPVTYTDTDDYWGLYQRGGMARPDPPGELDYLVGRRAIKSVTPGAEGRVPSVRFDEHDRAHREGIYAVTRPNAGPAEQRIKDALRGGYLKEPPDELLEKAFSVFEPRGLWLRLAALEPYDASTDEKSREVLERRRREAQEGLMSLRRVRMRSDALYRSDAETDSPIKEMDLFERRLGDLKSMLIDAEETATYEIDSLDWRRDQGFPEDSKELGLLERRRLVFLPVITALRRSDERFWRWKQIIDLVRRSDEYWSKDPCPETRKRYPDDGVTAIFVGDDGREHEYDIDDIINALKVDYSRAMFEQEVEQHLALATSPLTLADLEKVFPVRNKARSKTRKSTGKTTAKKKIISPLMKALRDLAARGRIRVEGAGYSIWRQLDVPPPPWEDDAEC